MTQSHICTFEGGGELKQNSNSVKTCLCGKNHARYISGKVNVRDSCATEMEINVNINNSTIT